MRKTGGRSLRAWLLLALSFLGGALAARGLWVPAKAALGQALLERAWHRLEAGDPDPRPWPWADTRPVARLELPRRGMELVVLEGASGQALAWGPGWVATSAPPGSAGHVVLAGHRDTSFRVLEHLEMGEPVVLESPVGPRVYRVVESRVVHLRDTSVLAPSGSPRLTLITCWPFDALSAGGPWRWVVVAEPGPYLPARLRPASRSPGK